MIETYRFRLYPTKEQEVLLSKHFGSVRFIYNWALDYDTKKYAQTQKHLGWISILNSGDYKKLKEEKPWLKEINSQSLQNSVSHLDKAFQKFFRHKAGFPKFKSKYDNHQSFEVPANLKIDFKTKKIQIPKFIKTKTCDNRLKFILSRRVKKGKIGTATISKNPSGQYFISFIVHTDEQVPKFNRDISKENSLGIDFGLKHFLNFSNGKKIDSPQYFKKALDKLAWEQRKLSKKKKGSTNKEKQRIKVAKIHQHITDQRNDFLHKLTTGLVKESQFDVFCLEDLNLNAMKKIWGRKVSDLSYYTFQRMLNYKCIKYGKKMIKIGRFEPSSQICSCCGHRQKMALNERTYNCSECGMSLDRDINAALNIRNFALRNILKNTDGRSGINAFGDGSSDKCSTSCTCETAVDELGKFSRFKLENGNHLQWLPASRIL